MLTYGDEAEVCYAIWGGAEGVKVEVGLRHGYGIWMWNL